MEARIEGVTGDVNAWIVGDDEEVIVIDPGAAASEVLQAVGEREILAVICTHAHGAHSAAALEVAERDEAPVAVHVSERVIWRGVHGDEDADIEIEDGGTFEVAGVQLEVVHAPGHSPGSVVLHCPDLDAVFVGDVLSADGPVPHDDDFPDFPRQLSAIGEKVLTLPPGTRVLPGHGPELTVADADKSFDAWAAAGPGGLLAAREGEGPGGIAGLPG